MKPRFFVRVIRKIQFLAGTASLKLGQLHWRLTQPGISSESDVDHTCRIERHSGCTLRIHGKCTIRSGVSMRLSQGGCIEFQDQVNIRQNCYIESWGSLLVGHNSGFNVGCYVVAIERITIGENVMIGPYAVIVDHSHGTSDRDIPMFYQGLETAPITIHDDVWLGAHVTVVKGVTIGKGAVIGANAVVTQDIPEYGIAVGVPAKVIGYRKCSALPIPTVQS